MSRFLSAIRPALLIAILASVAAMSPKPPAKTIDPTPAAFQAWRNALVQIDLKAIGPRKRGIFGRLRLVEGFFADLPANAKLPAILYLHDCAGLKIEAVRDVEELAAIGFAVFAPDSFDSRARKSDCIRFDFVAGLNP